MKRLMMLSALVLMPYVVYAQHTLSGSVTNAKNGEPVVGATVLLAKSNRGVVTNANGEYKWENLASGSYDLVVRSIGFETTEKSIELQGNRSLNFSLKPSATALKDVIITGTRATEKTPTTFVNVDKASIEKQNLGQDLPFLLNWTPSTVVTSDAGAGIGYTGIRIRGSDPTRINVTINGIPVNDSESQGVFWVNMPDFASSSGSIQVQRGVGTSTNGAGAFGASVNILTDGISMEPKGEINTTLGSYNTQKYNAIYSTGLLNDRWAFEGRLSQISSDGYIDRATSDLTSYYLSGGYFGKKTSLQFITFSGDERTYQSWWGTPEAKLKNDAEGIEAVIANNGYTPEQAENLRNSGRTFNYYLYENQVDDYGQDHYQLLLGHDVNNKLALNTALHYTKGSGFFEEFRDDEDLDNYGFDDVQIGSETISSTDLIRRRWLDNDFYGFTYDINYTSGNADITFGGAYNRYEGLHFGEVIWSQFAGDIDLGERFYESNSEKIDFNSYLKVNYQWGERLSLFGDVQFRKVDYTGLGIDNDLRPIDFDLNFNFFNPKVGLTYQLNAQSNFYGSFAVGNKEPNRSDIIDAPQGQQPVHEELYNLEVGFKTQTNNYFFEANYYWMDYTNQLVLTGEVNDVGAGIRTNVPDSYRMGIELNGGWKISSQFEWGANVALSRNKIQSFEEVIFDYGADFTEFNEVRTTFEDTDISFSPNIVAGSQLTFKPFFGFEVTWLSKYVGDQFLDNTSNENRKIDAFFVNDIRFNYGFSPKGIKKINLSLLVNNVLNEQYASNGYTFGYFGGADFEVRENYLYPQAGTNFLLSLGLEF